MPKSVLVTGAGGFLGSHLCEHYLHAGFRVVGVDNFCTGLRGNWDELRALPHAAENLRLIEADVTEQWEGWASKLPSDWADGLAFVFHFASPASPPHYQRLSMETIWVNTVGLRRCLEFADARKAKVVFASTSEIYGDPAVAPQPESYWGNVHSFGPRSCYDEAKRLGEALIYSHNLRHGTRHGLVRIFNTYGPRMNPDDGRVIINFLTQAMRGEPLTVYGTGTQTRSFCYVSDLIAGITAYTSADLAEPVNVGNDHEFTLLELVDIIQEVFPDQSLTVKHLSLPEDDPKRRRPDLTLARTLLAPWKPQLTLREGLRLMVRWLDQRR